MNTSLPSVAKWAVAILTCIAAGLLAYDQVHKGPPLNISDTWDLLMCVIKGAGVGAIGRGINVGIQKSQEKKDQ